MHLVRFRAAVGSEPAVGVLSDGRISPLPQVGGLSSLLQLSATDLRTLLAELAAGGSGTDALDAGTVELLAPIDGLTEVWAAGVTYSQSRQARVEESANSADVYDRVYSADRPELFFKSVAWRAVGPDRPVAIRSDSVVDVPEPELALVINTGGEIVGYTVCNDVSSRSIEGENPLYLPQAKVYLGSCAVGPGIRPVWEIEDPYALTISLTIDRGGAAVWRGTANTSGLHRRFEELTAYLLRAEHFPDGVILSTGTSLVPDLPFTLQTGDLVSIDIAEVGTLRNPVVEGIDGMSWLRP